MFIFFLICRCLYRISPVPCAEGHDDTAADMCASSDAAITAIRQNRKSKCM